MLKLNRETCEAMLAFDVHGCTDVTGFGLIGHAREMALASKVTLEIDPLKLRFLPGGSGVRQARGTLRRFEQQSRVRVILCRACVEGTSEFEDLLYDPQTSGGLLIALPERDAARLETKLPDAYRIGQATQRGNKPIRLHPTASSRSRSVRNLTSFSSAVMPPCWAASAAFLALAFLVSSAFCTHLSAVVDVGSVLVRAVVQIGLLADQQVHVGHGIVVFLDRCPGPSAGSSCRRRRWRNTASCNSSFTFLS